MRVKSFMPALLFACIAICSIRASAVELITNGGFETGNFTGWTVVNGPNPFEVWQVTGSGGGYVDNPVPVATSVTEGTRNAWQSVASNPGSFLLYQDVAVPAASSLTLSWQHRYQMNLDTYCNGSGCGTATFAVEILTTANSLLQTLYTTTTLPDTNTNTGWTTNSASLAPFAGQTIRIRFRTTVTATYAGPGRLEVDAVTTQAPTAAAASVEGRVKTADGRGIRNVTVTMTDLNGVARTTQTGSLGYYRFEDVEVGQQYVIAVSARRYTIADPTRLVGVNDSVSEVDFVAVE